MPVPMVTLCRLLIIYLAHRTLFCVARILVGATGRLELDFVCTAHRAKLLVVVRNPIQVRQLVRATGRGTKTDKLDALSIAHFGETL